MVRKKILFHCTCITYGLSTAPYDITKCLRPIVKYFRENFIDIVLYLHDGLAFADSRYQCENVSKLFKVHWIGLVFRLILTNPFLNLSRL